MEFTKQNKKSTNLVKLKTVKTNTYQHQSSPEAWQVEWTKDEYKMMQSLYYLSMIRHFDFFLSSFIAALPHKVLYTRCHITAIRQTMTFDVWRQEYKPTEHGGETFKEYFCISVHFWLFTTSLYPNNRTWTIVRSLYIHCFALKNYLNERSLIFLKRYMY